jgi:hypothetical protein
MKLREHPRMICGGIRNWPPIWVWIGGEKNEHPVAKSAFCEVKESSCSDKSN